MSFPYSSVGKESACNARDLGSILGLGRSPGEGIGSPLQYSGLENSMDKSMGLQRVRHNLATTPPTTATTLSNIYCFERFTEKNNNLSICPQIS